LNIASTRAEVVSATVLTAPVSEHGMRRRLSYRRMPLMIRVFASLGFVLIFVAVFGPWLTPHDPDATQILAKLKPPVPMQGSEWAHPLGTDQLGRDLLSRCIYGVRTSVGVALLGLIVGCLIGSILGVISGLVGGAVDRMIMMLVDVFISIPNLLIILVGIAIFGTDTLVLVVMIGIARWESYARIVRGQVLQVREMPYIEASRALGGSRTWIAVRHVLPNITSPLIVLLTLNFPSIMLLESSLSFLGIGVQPPTASLGSMVGDGRDHLIFAWWVAVAPAMVILIITFVVQLLGDWLRDVFDVRIDE